MSGALEVAGASIALPGDRGVRTIDNVPVEAYFAFGAVIRAYQRDHPDTLVRTTQGLNVRTGLGSITVRWWPRGEKSP